MMSRQSAGEADKLVRRYLTQLDAALQGVEASRRQEILAEVHEHIEEERTDAPPLGSGRWDAWAPWLIIFGPIASGLGWIAGMLILWPSPTWSQRDKVIATVVPLAGLVALFFGLVAALGGPAACAGHALHATAGCATKGITLPLGVAILLAVAGLAAHLLPPIHLMRTRRQRSTSA
jgi:hypothetical protein